MVLSSLITGLWGGLLALERRAFLQAALSRPLPAACGVGAMLGDLSAGLMVGLVFELFHLGAVSLGGANVDNETVPAVTGTALASTLGPAMGEASTPALWALSILVCAPTAILGRIVDSRLDARAGRYFGRLVNAVEEGVVEGAVRQNLRAMWPHFVFYGLVSALATVLGTLAGPLLHQVPPQVMRGLAWSYPVLGTVAAANAVHWSAGQGRLRLAALVALVVALLLLGTLHTRAWD
jgi:mannose/fructose/N-acetylgalactosamine-specific phosphotransferase system component IIC